MITRLFTFRIPNILQVSLKKEDINDLLWSVISVDPVPCRLTIWVAYTLAQVSSLNEEARIKLHLEIEQGRSGTKNKISN